MRITFPNVARILSAGAFTVACTQPVVFDDDARIDEVDATSRIDAPVPPGVDAPIPMGTDARGGSDTPSARIDAPVGPPGDFEARCAAPGVARCYGFEDPAHVAARIFEPSDGSAVRAAVVSDVVASGTGALRFEVPGRRPADTSGSMWLNFSDDLSVQFGEGETFAVQFRQRFSAEMLRDFEGGNGWKQIILGEGDQPGLDTVYSCTELELVLQQNAPINGPWFYHSCGRFDSLDYWPDGAAQVLMQHQGPPYCYYPDDPDRGCFRYRADEWMTFQVLVDIGTWNTPSSRVRVYAANQGMPSVEIFDSNRSHPDGFVLYNNPGSGSGTHPGARYGKLWLTPYNTGRSASADHPTAYTWYDEVIIADRRIPDPL